MHEALVEIHESILPKLRTEPYASQLEIIGEPILTGDGYLSIKVQSPALVVGFKNQELYFEGDKVKFKRWTDT